MYFRVLLLGIFANQLTISSTAFAAESLIPCKMVHDLCFIKGAVGERQGLWFALDTGASISVLDTSVASFLGTPVKEVPVAGSGAGGGQTVAKIYEGVKIQLGDTEILKEQTVVGLPLKYITDGIGYPTHGILGAPLFFGYVVTLNYQKHQVILSSEIPKELTGKGRRNRLRIDSSSGLPVVNATITLPSGESIEGDFFIDSGQVGTDISINEPFRKAYIGKISSIPLQRTAITVVGGLLKVDVGELPRMLIGSSSVENLRTIFPVSPTIGGIHAREDIVGVIGAGVLKRFITVFDYRGLTLTLIPNEQAR